MIRPSDLRVNPDYFRYLQKWFLMLGYAGRSVTLVVGQKEQRIDRSGQSHVEILKPKSMRRSTRLRVQIPLTMTSLDRRHPFVAECVALLVSPQGAGLQAPQALPIETPVMLNGLPAGASTSARVANCLPLGKDGRHFLIGVSLYNPGNVWGIAQPPEDWECAASAASPAPAAAAAAGSGVGQGTGQSSQAWPYNVFSGNTEAHPKQK